MKRRFLAEATPARSLDGGVSFDIGPFSPPIQVEHAWFIGHYNSIAAFGGRALAAFSNAGGFMGVARLDLAPPPWRRAAGP